ncbi:MAG TPA: MBOAT family protein [Candidatus Baltobacteraceae bacterium]|jgi:alginate O-acetyltransferase complex protein AlgI
MKRLVRLSNVLLVAVLLFVAADALLFYTPIYRNVVDPDSSAGDFEAARRVLLDFTANPRTDVLVVGDSRIYSGLDPATAAAAAGGELRFVNGGVRGTTPRCWYYFLHEIDPTARRFHALVIPVDTYADDDSAIGSIDGDQREQDLHYLVFAVAPAQIPKIAGTFDGLTMQLTTGLDLLLRGPILRDDIQAFAADPGARFAAIARARAKPFYAPLVWHPREETLEGMRVDFRRNQIQYPPGVTPEVRAAMPAQVLRIPHASPTYAAYRREWLYPIVKRYVAAGTPVIFVRIPTRPAHRNSGEALGASLKALARSGLARLLPAQGYMSLEQPALFADHDHLNRDGSLRFSELLGRDVARALAGSAPPQHSLIGPMPPASTLQFPIQSMRWGIGAAVLVAIVAAFFYVLPTMWRRYLLLIASYVFYAAWNGWYVVFLFALTASDFFIALALERTFGRRRRLLLAAGVAANLAFLGTFKYANLTTATISALFGVHPDPWLVNWIVPIGISFHTFQSISYLVDVYRAKTPAIRSAPDYALYIAFFPQLLSGPIVRAGLFFGELLHWKPPNASDVAYAAGRITFGLFKKLAIADQFAPAVDAYFGASGAHPGAPAAWTAAFAFSMQIYFDFSAYTDIAVGTARLFGFVFPENFNLPYLATSVTDFWHRWHMTLSTWLRDYLYIPLGGSRGGRLSTIRNLMITMLLGGLWHGAQWTFVAWGGLHGLFLAFERITGIGKVNPSNRPMVALRALLTFTAVTLAWIPFRAQSFSQAFEIYRAMFTGGPGSSTIAGWCAVIAGAVVLFGIVRIALGENAVRFTWAALPRFAQASAITAMLLGAELFSWPGAAETFIYFKF